MKQNQKSAARQRTPETEAHAKASQDDSESPRKTERGATSIRHQRQDGPSLANQIQQDSQMESPRKEQYTAAEEPQHQVGADEEHAVSYKAVMDSADMEDAYGLMLQKDITAVFHDWGEVTKIFGEETMIDHYKYDMETNLSTTPELANQAIQPQVDRLTLRNLARKHINKSVLESTAIEGRKKGIGRMDNFAVGYAVNGIYTLPTARILTSIDLNEEDTGTFAKQVLTFLKQCQSFEGQQAIYQPTAICVQEELEIDEGTGMLTSSVQQINLTMLYKLLLSGGYSWTKILYRDSNNLAMARWRKVQLEVESRCYRHSWSHEAPTLRKQMLECKFCRDSLVRANCMVTIKEWKDQTTQDPCNQPRCAEILDRHGNLKAVPLENQRHDLRPQFFSKFSRGSAPVIKSELLKTMVAARAVSKHALAQIIITLDEDTMHQNKHPLHNAYYYTKANLPLRHYVFGAEDVTTQLTNDIVGNKFRQKEQDLSSFLETPNIEEAILKKVLGTVAQSRQGVRVSAIAFGLPTSAKNKLLEKARNVAVSIGQHCNEIVLMDEKASISVQPCCIGRDLHSQLRADNVTCEKYGSTVMSVTIARDNKSIKAVHSISTHNQRAFLQTLVKPLCSSKRPAAWQINELKRDYSQVEQTKLTLSRRQDEKQADIQGKVKEAQQELKMKTRNSLQFDKKEAKKIFAEALKQQQEQYKTKEQLYAQKILPQQESKMSIKHVGAISVDMHGENYGASQFRGQTQMLLESNQYTEDKPQANYEQVGFVASQPLAATNQKSQSPINLKPATGSFTDYANQEREREQNKRSSPRRAVSQQRNRMDKQINMDKSKEQVQKNVSGQPKPKRKSIWKLKRKQNEMERIATRQLKNPTEYILPEFTYQSKDLEDCPVLEHVNYYDKKLSDYRKCREDLKSLKGKIEQGIVIDPRKITRAMQHWLKFQNYTFMDKDAEVYMIKDCENITREDQIEIITNLRAKSQVPWQSERDGKFYQVNPDHEYLRRSNLEQMQNLLQKLEEKGETASRELKEDYKFLGGILFGPLLLHSKTSFQPNQKVHIDLDEEVKKEKGQESDWVEPNNPVAAPQSDHEESDQEQESGKPLSTESPQEVQHWKKKPSRRVIEESKEEDQEELRFSNKQITQPPKKKPVTLTNDRFHLQSATPFLTQQLQEIFSNDNSSETQRVILDKIQENLTRITKIREEAAQSEKQEQSERFKLFEERLQNILRPKQGDNKEAQGKEKVAEYSIHKALDFAKKEQEVLQRLQNDILILVDGVQDEKGLRSLIHHSEVNRVLKNRGVDVDEMSKRLMDRSKEVIIASGLQMRQYDQITSNLNVEVTNKHLQKIKLATQGDTRLMQLAQALECQKSFIRSKHSKTARLPEGESQKMAIYACFEMRKALNTAYVQVTKNQADKLEERLETNQQERFQFKKKLCDLAMNHFNNKLGDSQLQYQISQAHNLLGFTDQEQTNMRLSEEAKSEEAQLIEEVPNRQLKESSSPDEEMLDHEEEERILTAQRQIQQLLPQVAEQLLPQPVEAEQAMNGSIVQQLSKLGLMEQSKTNASSLQIAVEKPSKSKRSQDLREDSEEMEVEPEEPKSKIKARRDQKSDRSNKSATSSRPKETHKRLNANFEKKKKRRSQRVEVMSQLQQIEEAEAFGEIKRELDSQVQRVVAGNQNDQLVQSYTNMFDKIPILNQTVENYKRSLNSVVSLNLQMPQSYMPLQKNYMQLKRQISFQTDQLAEIQSLTNPTGQTMSHQVYIQELVLRENNVPDNRTVERSHEGAEQAIQQQQETKSEVIQYSNLNTQYLQQSSVQFGLANQLTEQASGNQTMGTDESHTQSNPQGSMLDQGVESSTTPMTRATVNKSLHTETLENYMIEHSSFIQHEGDEQHEYLESMKSESESYSVYRQSHRSTQGQIQQPQMQPEIIQLSLQQLEKSNQAQLNKQSKCIENLNRQIDTMQAKLAKETAANEQRINRSGIIPQQEEEIKGLDPVKLEWNANDLGNQIYGVQCMELMQQQQSVCMKYVKHKTSQIANRVTQSLRKGQVDAVLNAMDNLSKYDMEATNILNELMNVGSEDIGDLLAGMHEDRDRIIRNYLAGQTGKNEITVDDFDEKQKRRFIYLLIKVAISRDTYMSMRIDEIQQVTLQHAKGIKLKPGKGLPPRTSNSKGNEKLFADEMLHNQRGEFKSLQENYTECKHYGTGDTMIIDLEAGENLKMESVESQARGLQESQHTHPPAMNQDHKPKSVDKNLLKKKQHQMKLGKTLNNWAQILHAGQMEIASGRDLRKEEAFLSLETTNQNGETVTMNVPDDSKFKILSNEEIANQLMSINVERLEEARLNGEPLNSQDRKLVIKLMHLVLHRSTNSYLTSFANSVILDDTAMLYNAKNLRMGRTYKLWLAFVSIVHETTDLLAQLAKRHKEEQHMPFKSKDPVPEEIEQLNEAAKVVAVMSPQFVASMLKSQSKQEKPSLRNYHLSRLVTLLYPKQADHVLQLNRQRIQSMTNKITNTMKTTATHHDQLHPMEDRYASITRSKAEEDKMTAYITRFIGLGLGFDASHPLPQLVAAGLLARDHKNREKRREIRRHMSKLYIKEKILKNPKAFENQNEHKMHKVIERLQIKYAKTVHDLYSVGKSNKLKRGQQVDEQIINDDIQNLIAASFVPEDTIIKLENEEEKSPSAIRKEASPRVETIEVDCDEEVEVVSHKVKTEPGTTETVSNQRIRLDKQELPEELKQEVEENLRNRKDEDDMVHMTPVTGLFMNYQGYQSIMDMIDLKCPAELVPMTTRYIDFTLKQATVNQAQDIQDPIVKRFYLDLLDYGNTVDKESLHELQARSKKLWQTMQGHNDNPNAPDRQLLQQTVENYRRVHAQAFRMPFTETKWQANMQYLQDPINIAALYHHNIYGNRIKAQSILDSLELHPLPPVDSPLQAAELIDALNATMGRVCYENVDSYLRAIDRLKARNDQEDYDEILANRGPSLVSLPVFMVKQGNQIGRISLQLEMTLNQEETKKCRNAEYFLLLLTQVQSNRILLEVWYEYSTLKEATVAYYAVTKSHDEGLQIRLCDREGLTRLDNAEICEGVTGNAAIIRVISASWHKEKDDAAHKDRLQFIHRALTYETEVYRRQKQDQYLSNTDLILGLKYRRAVPNQQLNEEELTNLMQTHYMDKLSRKITDNLPSEVTSRAQHFTKYTNTTAKQMRQTETSFKNKNAQQMVQFMKKEEKNHAQVLATLLQQADAWLKEQDTEFLAIITEIANDEYFDNEVMQALAEMLEGEELDNDIRQRLNHLLYQKSQQSRNLERDYANRETQQQLAAINQHRQQSQVQISPRNEQCFNLTQYQATGSRQSASPMSRKSRSTTRQLPTKQQMATAIDVDELQQPEPSEAQSSHIQDQGKPEVSPRSAAVTITKIKDLDISSKTSSDNNGQDGQEQE